MAPRKGNIPWNKGRAAKHGDWGSREYRAWIEIRQRCTNPKHHAYEKYGGRGIGICTRWDCYENFLADMGRRPSSKHSIDRIDNDGDYEPKNCRWATPSEQARNRRNCNFLTIDGVQMTTIEAAERYDVPAHRIRQRLARGWSVEDAVCLPADQNRYRKDRAIELAIADIGAAAHGGGE